MNNYYVYILANRVNGALYIGITSNLPKRVWEHKSKIVEGFTAKYNINKLVYFEQYNEAHIAINREKRIKKWPRIWKIELINQYNPQWLDLYSTIV